MIKIKTYERQHHSFSDTIVIGILFTSLFKFDFLVPNSVVSNGYSFWTGQFNMIGLPDLSSEQTLTAQMLYFPGNKQAIFPNAQHCLGSLFLCIQTMSPTFGILHEILFRCLCFSLSKEVRYSTFHCANN